MPNNAIRLILTPPGDATNDGSVQFDDFVILAEYFGADGVDGEQGDFDGDGQVQFPDFVLLANNFGTTPSSASTVPEPMPLLLLLLGVAIGCNAARRLAK